MNKRREDLRHSGVVRLKSIFGGNQVPYKPNLGIGCIDLPEIHMDQPFVWSPVVSHRVLLTSNIYPVLAINRIFVGDAGRM